MGSWDDGAPGYGQDDDYAAPGGYGGYGGYGPDDSYAGYDDYGHGGGYAASGGYAHDGGGYAHDGGGYAGDGYGARYGQPASHGQQDHYGGYQDLSSGPGLGSGLGSGPYEQRRAGQDYLAGDYPARGYGRSGGYPALGAGSSDQDAGGYCDAGNDWYSAQPAAASGSGFADTGTLDARAVASYGTGPLTVHDPVRGFPPSRSGPQHQLDPAPQDLVHAGRRDNYDEGQYDSYAGYDQGDYDEARGYGSTGGYQTALGYDQYDEPEAFHTRGYDDDRDYDDGLSPDLAPGYDDYDPYQEPYGDGGTATGPGDGGKSGRKKNGREKRAIQKSAIQKSAIQKSGIQKSGKKKRVKLLLLSAAAVVIVGIAGAAAYTFILKPKTPASNSALSAGPLPSTGSTSAATQACVNQLGPYCHIELRSDDPVPLTLAELFPPAFLNESDHISFTRLATKLDKTCSNAVIGQDLISALRSDKCTQVLRASYASDNNTIIGTIGVFNLETTNDAHHAGRLVGANDFVAPLSTSKGIGSKLSSGTGVVEAEYKGHYLLLIWAEFNTGKAPKTPAQDRQLAQFEADLVAGTANPALSERMVNGSPTTPAS
jgi:hypothetical protein